MTARTRALLLVVLAGGLVAPLGSGPAGAAEELTYAAKARTHVYRVALRKEVIEGARNAQPCDPEEDPYRCDDAAYNHRPNCDPSIAVGRTRAGPKATPPEEAERIEGAAGGGAGPEEEPPLSSAVTLNEMVSLGSLVHNGTVAEAAGLASSGYVDLNGRRDPELHTESDAFTPNRPDYQERCLRESEDAPSYRHFLSRSSDGPETYHLSECAKDECTLDRLTFFAEAVRARTIVHLVERGGRVEGRLKTSLQEFSWRDGALAVEALDTYVDFASDGTAEGLKWSVATTAAGATLGGQPVALPPGRLVGTAELQVGVAAPHVRSTEDGRTLRIVAPGLVIASPEQTVYVAGAELDVGALGRRAPGPSYDALAAGTAAAPAAAPAATTPETVEEDAAPPAPDAEEAPQAAPVVSLRRVDATGAPAMALILTFGLLGSMAVLMRWMNRFPWWSRALRAPPLSGLHWLYRAFMKT